MSNNVDVYNGDIISMLPGSQQDPPLYKSINGDGITDRNSAGEIQAIKLDMTKAGNTFIDLRPIFNANQSDGNVEMPIMPLMYGRQAPLDGFRGEIHGIYPDKIHTFDVDTALGNTGNIYRFLWPTGVFQTTGKYIFTITFINDNTGEKITSKECFFEVEPNLLTMAVNFSEGVNPFDSEYERWKNDVNTKYNDFLDKINTLNGTADKIDKLMQDTLNKTNQYVEQAWDSKLSGNNTWTGTNTFNGELTAGSINSDKIVATTLASLPANTKVGAGALKNVGNNLSRGLFTLEAEYNASTVSSENKNGVSFLNGVTAGAGGQHYMSFRVFRFQIADGSTRTIVEIHANCAFNSSINGKSVVQFPSNASVWDGIDQTPFVLGNWCMQFDKSTNSLKAMYKVNTNISDYNCLDARMI